LPDRALLTRRMMRDLEATLDPAAFVRVRRSHVVALPYVREPRALGDGVAYGCFVVAATDSGRALREPPMSGH
jgi:hypothetical protein